MSSNGPKSSPLDLDIDGRVEPSSKRPAFLDRKGIPEDLPRPQRLGSRVKREDVEEVPPSSASPIASAISTTSARVGLQIQGSKSIQASITQRHQKPAGIAAIRPGESGLWDASLIPMTTLYTGWLNSLTKKRPDLKEHLADLNQIEHIFLKKPVIRSLYAHREIIPSLTLLLIATDTDDFGAFLSAFRYLKDNNIHLLRLLSNWFKSRNLHSNNTMYSIVDDPMEITSGLSAPIPYIPAVKKDGTSIKIDLYKLIKDLKNEQASLHSR